MAKNLSLNWKITASISVLFLLVASIAVVVNYLPQQRGTQPRAASIAYNSETSDGTIGKHRSSNPGDGPGNTCWYINNDNYLWLGQENTGSERQSLRSFLAFNTADLPDNADVTSVSLSLKPYSSSHTPYYHFTINVRNYNWGPSVECDGDWRVGNPPPDLLVGSLYTSPLTDPVNISLNLTDPDNFINKAGLTYLYLTSDRDESDTDPLGNEGYVFWSREANPNYWPKLTVNYTIPSCSNECSSAGAKQCAGNTAYQTCGNYDADSCLEWSSFISCPSGQTCSGSGVCSTSGGGTSGGGTSGGGTSGGKKTGGGVSNTSTNFLVTFQLQLSVPYLIGSLKIPITIGSFKKEIEVSPDKKDYQLDVKEANITIGSSLTVVVGGNKTLIKKVQIVPIAEPTTVNFGDLILGDITSDNKIDDKDGLALLDSITKQTTKGDLNADKATNSLDWAILLVNFGKSGDF